MNSYGCYYYAINDNKELIKNGNNACWAGLLNNWNTKKIKGTPNYIYINYNRLGNNLTQEQLNRFIQLLNNITPCKLVTLDYDEAFLYKHNNQDFYENLKNKDFIKYKLINKSYGANLVLLNFIRMIWYKPDLFDYDKFFELIMNKSRGIDSLYFLLNCVKECVKEKGTCNYYIYGGHSLVYNNIKPKKSRDLKNYLGKTMQYFLTT